METERPKGKLTAKNGQEPYPLPYAIITGVGKRRVYTDEAGQRWIKAFRQYWQFPNGVEL